jgi:Spy/CpxP family protein refolding chaperone
VIFVIFVIFVCGPWRFRTMTKRMLIAAGLVAALAGGTAVSFAQGPGGPGGPGIERQRGPRGGPRIDFGLRGVQLTESQREQVQSIMQSHRTEFENAAKALRDAHRAFGDATRAATIDEAAIRQHSTAVASAMADDAILRAKVRAEVHALLTPEQQQQLKDREAAMQKRVQERQQRLQPRQRQPQ